MYVDLIPHLLPMATAAGAHGKSSVWCNFARRTEKLLRSQSAKLTKRYHISGVAN